MQYLDLCIINLQPCDRGRCSAVYSCFMITCGRGMWNHHQQGWFKGTVNNISTHFTSLFRKGLREMERCLYSNFYASSEWENGEIYEGFANVLVEPFRHSLYKENYFFHTKEFKWTQRCRVPGKLTPELGRRTGPSGPAVCWGWNPAGASRTPCAHPSQSLLASEHCLESWREDTNQSWTEADFYVRTHEWWLNHTWGDLSFTNRGFTNYNS